MPFLPRLLTAALALAAASGLTACSGDGSSSSSSASPTPAPAVQLAALARSGLAESYTGTYALRRDNGETGRVVVRRTPTSYRLDVTVKGNTGILLRNSTGVYSCGKAHGKGKLTCLKVAAPGKPVPALFNAGQQVFSDYLSALVKAAPDYTLTVADPTPANGTVPAGTCFALKPAGAPAPVVVAGTYCLSATGIPIKAAFPSGTLTLRRLDPPPTVRLVPPAKPTPIPGTGKGK